ncbi:MAG: hypothetical protein KA524_01975 [Nitrosomonas sp.]|nr:hypothetical protein [Nitrosomonas sp.]MBP6074975.1 hypothetical protein [Nitrosomonas sp.]
MRKILFVVLVSMMFSSNLYAKKAKSSASKGTLSSKSAVTQPKKTDTPNQPAPTQASAAGSNAAANAPTQNPSLLQSVMPALVGGAVGSYVGSKLADDGSTEKSTEEKKEEHPLTAR